MGNDSSKNFTKMLENKIVNLNFSDLEKKKLAGYILTSGDAIVKRNIITSGSSFEESVSGPTFGAMELLASTFGGLGERKMLVHCEKNETT
jgi:hypothetical protein